MKSFKNILPILREYFEGKIPFVVYKIFLRDIVGDCTNYSFMDNDIINLSNTIVHYIYIGEKNFKCNYAKNW